MDLRLLSRLYDTDGPFVTIYLDTGGAVENAGSRLELRWKDVLRELADRGVDEATREALTAARGDHRQGGTRVLVAAGGRVRYARSLPEATDVDVVRVAPLPYLLPLVDWAQTRIPHLVVLTDRLGADILAYTDSAEPVEVETVVSGRFPFHKTGLGGWWSFRFDHKVERGWDASARDVAAEVDKVADDVGARLVVAAGDERATTLLREHLPPALQRCYVVVPGGRARDGSDEAVAGHVLEALGERVRAEVAELLDEFDKYRNRAARQAASPQFGGQRPGVAANAADGPEQVVEALRMAQVGTLLLAEDLGEDRLAFFGPEPVHLALRPEELVALGVARPREGALVDVLLRAALCTDAQVRIVPSTARQSPTGGVGALLRYTLPA